MVGAVVLTYGFLMSFILGATSRNARERRPNPRMVEVFGYILCGITGTLSIVLFGAAAAGASGVALF